ncbi:MAG TPA: ParB N-terminal domain-containing protein [Candidatus Thermoplasmatota archaeon]|nr:ParB N-terminal domain-containing protein [Candidatus Thermoplasmatota archaeon]
MPASDGLQATLAIVDVKALKPHEQIVEKHVTELVEAIRKAGGITRPILADRETLTVLDGHHRLEALKRLRIPHAPVQLVNYHAKDILLDVWRKNEPVPTKDEVIARAMAGDLYTPKTTRHILKEELREVKISLKELE